MSAWPVMAQNKAQTEADTLWLDQMVVTGTRTPKALKDVPIQTRLVTAADIKKTDATNVQDLLQQELPGVEFSFAMSQQTHMNFSGFGGQSVLFLVDGERMAGETMDDVDFTRLVMTNVERIEIIKGAASALYGSNAAGGVINVITKTPRERWTLNVNGRMARHGEYRYGLQSGVNGKWVQNMLTVHGTNIDNYQVMSTQQPGFEPLHMWSTFYGDRTLNVSDKLTWRPMKDLRVTGKVGYFFRNKNTTSEMLPDRYRDFSGSLRAMWNVTDNDDLELQYTFDQYDKAQLNKLSNREVRNYSNVQNAVRALYNHTFAGGDMLTVGADFMNDYLLNQKTRGGEHEQRNFDMFAQYDWNIADKWELVSALRYDYFNESGKGTSRVTPKVNVRYKPLSNLNLRAGYGMGFRAPTLKEKYYNFNIGNGIWELVGSNVVGKELKPEVSHNFNVSADYTHGVYNVTLSGFYNLIDNRITTGIPQRREVYPGDPADLEGNMLWLPYTNVKDYSIYGFDLTAQAKCRNGWGAKLSYAYVHEQLPEDENGEPINNQYQPARPHSLTLRVDWDHQFHKHYGINVALNCRYLSSVRNIEYTDYTTIDPQTGRLLRTEYNFKAYSIWKLSLQQRIWRGITLNVAVDNLFDYKPKLYYFNAPMTDGRNLMVGVSLDIDKVL